MSRTRTIHFGKGRGVRLTKQFNKGVDRIVFRPLGKGGSFTLPVTCIDQTIQALLDLKVLMEDGGDYNSGCMRAALIDGSGREIAVADLSDNGMDDAIFQAKRLIEKVRDAQDEDDAASEDEEDEEDEEDAEAVEGCYYGDPDVCNGPLWACDTCHEQYCEAHFHETDKGRNVECVACERRRKDDQEQEG